MRVAAPPIATTQGFLANAPTQVTAPHTIVRVDGVGGVKPRSDVSPIRNHLSEAVLVWGPDMDLRHNNQDQIFSQPIASHSAQAGPEQHIGRSIERQHVLSLKGMMKAQGQYEAMSVK
jgi:hypothetical protein